MEIKHRGENGQLNEPVQIGSTLNIDSQVTALGMQLTQEKLANLQKEAVINGLGVQVVQMKLEIMALKGGEAG